MKTITLGATLALVLMGAAPLAAQPAPNYGGQGYGGPGYGGPPPGGPGRPGGWDGGAFWRGAPEGPRERIEFLQQRINRGLADGSLDRREGRRSQIELNNIRRMAMDLHRRDRGPFSPEDRASIQRRLDDLSQRIQWRRHNW